MLDGGFIGALTSAKKPSNPLYSPGGWTIYDFSNEEYFALEAMIRKKAVGPRTKLTLSDIFHL